MINKLIHEKFLPFSEDIVARHFNEIILNGKSNRESHLNYFKNSIERYNRWKNDKMLTKDNIATCRQVEKDERFFTTKALLSIWYDSNGNIRNNRIELLMQFLERSFDFESLPMSFQNLEALITQGNSDNLKLCFEPSLPSPESYRKYLESNVSDHPVPYIRESAKSKSDENKIRSNLEGASQIDAIIYNTKSGFSIIIEAKFLSDISCQIRYDTQRNQMIRNLDVMIQDNRERSLPDELNKRDPDKSLFMLLTPEQFRMNKKSRLYGYKYLDYTQNPNLLRADFRRTSSEELDQINFENLSRRIGWGTFEDIEKFI